MQERAINLLHRYEEILVYTCLLLCSYKKVCLFQTVPGYTHFKITAFIFVDSTFVFSKVLDIMAHLANVKWPFSSFSVSSSFDLGMLP